MTRYKLHQHRQKMAPKADGFTIVELMVALMVLSTLLLISSVTLVTIGKLFSKNVNEISAQNTARSIMNDVASAIQLGGNAPAQIPPTVAAKGKPAANAPSNQGVLCVGNVRYVYIINGKLNSYSPSNDYNHVLWRETLKSSGACPTPVAGYLKSNYPADSDVISHSGAELMPINMRLNDISVKSNPNATYTVKLTIAFGDDDLIIYDPVADTTTCSGNTGTEYCAVSSLTQTIVQRIIQQ